MLVNTEKEDFTMRIKYVTEKEVPINEDAEFRIDFLNNLASSLTESSFKDDSIPYSSIKDIQNASDLDDWHKTLYCTLYYEGVIKHLAKVFSILNDVSNNYHILPFIPDTVDDKINFINDLESHFHFTDLPSAVNFVPATIIKKDTNSENIIKKDKFVMKAQSTNNETFVEYVDNDFTDPNFEFNTHK
jgi:hypothetical protein